eukprot:scaffold11206_cov117-Isochrysis_galbana.AAC.7
MGRTRVAQGNEEGSLLAKGDSERTLRFIGGATGWTENKMVTLSHLNQKLRWNTHTQHTRYPLSLYLASTRDSADYIHLNPETTHELALGARTIARHSMAVIYPRHRPRPRPRPGGRKRKRERDERASGASVRRWLAPRSLFTFYTS